MATVPPPTRRPFPRALSTEANRFWLAFGAATVPALLCQLLLVDLGPAWSNFTVLVVWYGAHLLLHSLAVAVAFHLDFATARREPPSADRSWRRRLLHVDPNVDLAVWFSAFALAAAVALAATGVSARSAVLAVGTVVLVVGAWVDVLVSFAADYARRDHRAGGLDFPGERPEAFADYVYFSAAVTTTFGPTDVTVTTREVRRLVLLHALVAFVFNTVVLALLISTLLG